MANTYKKMMAVGPGGKKCVCCFPAPGSKARKALYKIAKKRAAREDFRCISLDNAE